jgi:hypothetical protein
MIFLTLVAFASITGALTGAVSMRLIQKSKNKNDRLQGSLDVICILKRVLREELSEERKRKRIEEKVQKECRSLYGSS